MAPALRRLVPFLLVLHAGIVLRAADKNPAAEVQQLDATRVSALLKGDVAALEQLFSDQLVYIHANGRVDTKSGYLSMLRGGDLAYVSLQYDPPAQIRVVADTAIVTGRASIEAKNKSGQVTKRILTTTTVYVRTPAGWKVVSYQGTPAT
jgi:ketosteroid isomerase-like protein